MAHRIISVVTCWIYSCNHLDQASEIELTLSHSDSVRREIAVPSKLHVNESQVELKAGWKFRETFDGVGNRTYDINTVAAVTTTRASSFPSTSNRI
jgi:hypothetical protein